jgi:serine/threonine-protein kinase
MPVERSQRIEQLYHAARERNPGERVAFLEQACAGDLSLRLEVESLLAEDNGVQSFLEAPALEVGLKMSGEDASQSMIGRRFGPYSVVSLLAKGGMGEVYRARDTQLQRDVALKLLPKIFASDAERLARFQREAQVLAALNHPNIAQIYGLEGAGSSRCIVMELVDGDTLEERLKRGPVSVKEALAIAEQIIEGLEAAHEKDIIHRDLKPANVKITPEGRVKILDFGLAKPLEEPIRSTSDLATLRVSATDQGVILGTAAYMSPEQARGEKVDKRTDMWAFGCVLYQLLTGKQAFDGVTVTDTLAAVLNAEPDWNRLPAATPTGIRALLRRCLQKDVTRRLRDVSDAQIEIQDAIILPAAANESRHRNRGGWFAAAAGLLLTIIGAAMWGWVHTRPAELQPVTRWTITLPGSDLSSGLSLSRDGTRLAYNGGNSGRIWLRVLDQPEGKPIPGTEGGLRPFFSPDGQWLVYFTGRGALRKVPVTGGTPITLCEEAAFAGGGWWGDDDRIIFQGRTNGLARVSASGGSCENLTTAEQQKGEMRHRWPQLLPGGQAILFTIVELGVSTAPEIAILDLKTGRYRVVGVNGMVARYVPSGHLVYVRGGAIFAVPFDVKRLAVTGSEAPVIEGIYNTSGFADYAFSDSGLLVYMRPADPKSLEWLDRSGTSQASPAPRQDYESVRLSPDGQRAAVVLGPNGGADIWILDLARGALTRLTDERNWGNPVWTPDSRRVVFGWGRFGNRPLRWAPADGSSKPEPLSGTQEGLPNSWTPDGTTLLYQSERSPVHIWALRPDESGGDGKPRLLFQATSFDDTDAQVSPDGRSVAYTSNDSGKNRVYYAAASRPRRQGTSLHRRRTGASLVPRRARAVLPRLREEPADGGGYPDQSHISRRIAARAVPIGQCPLGRCSRRQAIPGGERTGGLGQRSENASSSELVP